MLFVPGDFLISLRTERWESPKKSVSITLFFSENLLVLFQLEFACSYLLTKHKSYQSFQKSCKHALYTTFDGVSAIKLRPSSFESM